MKFNWVLEKDWIRVGQSDKVSGGEDNPPTNIGRYMAAEKTLWIKTKVQLRQAKRAYLKGFLED